MDVETKLMDLCLELEHERRKKKHQLSSGGIYDALYDAVKIASEDI